MRYSKYTIFLKVVELESFSKTADFYKYSQSAVTQIVKSLEAELQMIRGIQQYCVSLSAGGDERIPKIISGNWFWTAYGRLFQNRAVDCWGAGRFRIPDPAGADGLWYHWHYDGWNAGRSSRKASNDRKNRDSIKSIWGWVSCTASGRRQAGNRRTFQKE